MLAEIAVVDDGVKSWRVELREGWVGVLAMEAFLKAVDPGKNKRKM